MTDMTQNADAAARPALPATMTAWRQHRYGGPEAVEAETLPLPAPAADEVLLRVRSTSLNSGDVRLLRGEPLLVRLVFGLRRPKHPGRGMDVAGTVVAVGRGVDAFAVGDEVVGELPGGGLAPYVIAPVDRLVHRPVGVGAVGASTLPIAGGTAWRALELATVGAGGRVLVVGASGGVGTFTVQLAVARGLEVWALTGERSRPLVERLGAVRTFDYRVVQPGSDELEATRFDAVIDIAGTAPLRSLQRLVKRGGTVVLVSGSGGRMLGPLGRIARSVLLSRPSARLKPLAATPDTGILSSLLERVAEGSIEPVVERTWPLAEAREALTHVDAGHTLGKIVVEC